MDWTPSTFTGILHDNKETNSFAPLLALGGTKYPIANFDKFENSVGKR